MAIAVKKILRRKKKKSFLRNAFEVSCARACFSVVSTHPFPHFAFAGGRRGVPAVEADAPPAASSSDPPSNAAASSEHDPLKKYADELCASVYGDPIASKYVGRSAGPTHPTGHTSTLAVSTAEAAPALSRQPLSPPLDPFYGLFDTGLTSDEMLDLDAHEIAGFFGLTSPVGTPGLRVKQDAPLLTSAALRSAITPGGPLYRFFGMTPVPTSRRSPRSAAAAASSSAQPLATAADGKPVRVPQKFKFDEFGEDVDAEGTAIRAAGAPTCGSASRPTIEPVPAFNAPTPRRSPRHAELLSSALAGSPATGLLGDIRYNPSQQAKARPMPSILLKRTRSS